MLRARMLTPADKQLLPEALKAAQATTINFDRELKQFLPKSQVAVIRDFKANLEREIKNFV
jgi:hypothetical protein